LAQTHADLELILINDGSRDNSGSICDGWAEKDARVKVIHQENQGVSAARNAGLAIATGGYIGFVDADDEIAPETYEIVLQQMEDHDIVMWDTVTVWGDGRTEPDTIPLLEKDCTITSKDWTPALLGQMAGSACRCLYRAKSISGIHFPKGIKFSEDRLFNLHAMGRCSSLRYFKTALYYRLMHSESAVHRYHEDYFDACKLAHKAIIKALEQEWNREAGYVQVYNLQLISGAMSAIYNYFYKTSPLTLRQKRKKVRALCCDEYLQKVISQTEDIGLRGKMMKRKAIFALCVLASLTNKKHGR
jgi:glycosyltransferase involved in cell wall biosynthesis